VAGSLDGPFGSDRQFNDIGTSSPVDEVAAALMKIEYR
jgi:hypothetical protein